MKLLAYDDLQLAKGIKYSKVQLWRKVKENTFPAPVKISAARNAWIESEVDAWIADRIAQRDNRRETA